MTNVQESLRSKVVIRNINETIWKLRVVDSPCIEAAMASFHCYCKDCLSRYGDFHDKDDIIVRPSNCYNGNIYTSKTTSLYWDLLVCGFSSMEPVSLRIMTSQFKDIVTHTQKHETVKCIFCGVWVRNFVWNFKGALWNFTQNFEPIPKYAFYEVLKFDELWYIRIMTS